MNGIFQIVRSMDGVRSPAAEAARVEFARVLREMIAEGAVDASDLVICIMDDTRGDWDICRAPMMRADTFISHFAPEVIQ